MHTTEPQPKRKPGRPRLTGTERLSKDVHVLLNPSQFAKLTEAAAAAHRPAADLARLYVLRGLGILPAMPVVPEAAAA